MAGIRVSQVMVAFALVPRDTLFGMPLCGLKLSREAERTPAEMMCLNQEIVIAHLLS